MEACDGAVENARDARETTDIDRLARASARREDAIVVVVVVVCRARAGRGADAFDRSVAARRPRSGRVVTHRLVCVCTCVRGVYVHRGLVGYSIGSEIYVCGGPREALRIGWEMMFHDD
mgnify:FL=1